MKKILFVTLLCFSSLVAKAQREVFDDWLIAGGFNAVNSLGTLNPLASPGDWMFKTPISLSGELQWDRDFTFELALNINGIKEGKRFDPVPAPQDFTYVSFDLHVKYYFGRQIFRRGYDKIDLYANGGAGFFSINDTNLSINFGGGALFWLNENNTFGIRVQLISKFAINNANSGFENNHFQYGLHGVWRL